MDNPTDISCAPPQSQITKKGFAKRLALCLIAAALLGFGIVAVVAAIRLPSTAVDITTLDTPESVKAGDIYLINDLYFAGVFTYAGGDNSNSVPRNSGDGYYLDSKYVSNYFVLAIFETGGKNNVVMLSVDENDKAMFDRIAAWDKEKNNNNDKGATTPFSIYATAKNITGELNTRYKASQSTLAAAPGMENVVFLDMGMEYFCDADEDFDHAVTAKKRGPLIAAFVVFPIAVLVLYFAFRKPKNKATEDEPIPCPNNQECNTSTEEETPI